MFSSEICLLENIQNVFKDYQFKTCQPWLVIFLIVQLDILPLSKPVAVKRHDSDTGFMVLLKVLIGFLTVIFDLASNISTAVTLVRCYIKPHSIDITKIEINESEIKNYNFHVVCDSEIDSQRKNY